MNKIYLVFLMVVALAPLDSVARGTNPARVSWWAEVVVDGRSLMTYTHEGNLFVEGTVGGRYVIRLHNDSPRRVEAVVTVDGLDVMDGKAGDYVRKRGYVLEPWQTYDVEGFRLDHKNVAAFRFSSVSQSYAAKSGDDRNVGVIGVAFFAQRKLPRVRAQIAKKEREYSDRLKSVSASRSDLDATDKLSVGSAEVRGGGMLSEPTARPGLGTEFGEARWSEVKDTTFLRQNHHSPQKIQAIFYNDRDGLIAMGVPVLSDVQARMDANPFPKVKDRTFAKPPAGWRR